MIVVGDRIRVIPRSYIGMSKAFLNALDAWQEADAKTNSRVMLGGSYEVLAVRRTAFGTCVAVLENPAVIGEVSEYDVLQEREVELCPFHVGDRVKFRPQCSPQDLAYLRALSKPISSGDAAIAVHEVTEVLNDFYIFVDVAKGHEQAFPFRWIDFQLVT